MGKKVIFCNNTFQHNTLTGHRLCTLKDTEQDILKEKDLSKEKTQTSKTLYHLIVNTQFHRHLLLRFIE